MNKMVINDILEKMVLEEWPFFSLEHRPSHPNVCTVPNTISKPKLSLKLVGNDTVGEFNTVLITNTGCELKFDIKTKLVSQILMG